MKNNYNIFTYTNLLLQSKNMIYVIQTYLISLIKKEGKGFFYMLISYVDYLMCVYENNIYYLYKIVILTTYYE